MISNYAQQETEFWAWADEQLAFTECPRRGIAPELHSTPAARLWVVWLLPTIGDPFPLRVQVEAGYLGQGEAALVLQHCALHYSDHLTGEMWPIN